MFKVIPHWDFVHSPHIVW